MPYDFPKPLTYNAREDIDRLWEDLWRIVEQLRLAEEAQARQSGAETGGQTEQATTQARAIHLLPMGRVDGTASSTDKTATVSGIRSLKSGAACYIVNDGTASASGVTLNVNGLGQRRIYNSMSGASVTTTFAANAGYVFVYNEARNSGNGGWDMYYGYNANDNTLAYNVRTQQTDRILGDRITRYMFLFTQRDGRLVPSYTVASGNGTTATTKTLNTGKAFDPKRPIFYYSTTTNVASGNSPGGSYLWRQYYACEMRYAFNAGTSLVGNQPVYLRCVPQSDGTVTLDGNDCLVQSLDLPVEGRVYIYLGMAYGSTGYNMELDPEHPCYIYTNGALTPWNG